MLQGLEQIEYRCGMLERGMQPENLPVKVWRGAQIPVEIRKAINDEGLLDLGGVYGDKATVEQVEYDRLKLILADNTVEFEIFNRGLTLLMGDDEQVRRIHRVLCKLDKA